MSKANEGYVFQRGNKWVACVTFTTPDGKRKEQWRTSRDELHARELLAGMLANLETTKDSTANTDSNNGHSRAPGFKQVAAQYSAHKYTQRSTATTVRFPVFAPWTR